MLRFWCRKRTLRHRTYCNIHCDFIFSLPPASRDGDNEICLCESWACAEIQWHTVNAAHSSVSLYVILKRDWSLALYQLHHGNYVIPYQSTYQTCQGDHGKTLCTLRDTVCISLAPPGQRSEVNWEAGARCSRLLPDVLNLSHDV